MNEPPGPTSEEKRVHPLDKAGFFSQVLFRWVYQIIKTQRITRWTQNMHWNLPKRDDIRTNEQKFNDTFEIKRGLFSTILSTFKWDFIVGTVWAVFFVITDYSLTLMLFKIMSYLELTHVKVTPDTPDQAAKLAQGNLTTKSLPLPTEALWGFCSVLVMNLFAQLLSTLLQNWNQMHFSRLSVRIRSCIVQLILKKAFKFSILNPSEHSEGKILNFVQVDTQKFETSVFFVVNFLIAILQIIIGLGLIAYVAGETVWMVTICLVFANIVNVFIN
jgi:hypothetical protein